MSEKCEHKTAIIIHEATPSTPYDLYLCTWGCREVLAGMTTPDGISRTWAVSELIELMLLMTGVAA